MLRIITLIFFISSYLFANSEELITAYKMGDYEKSFKLANKICEKSCNEIWLNLILGKSAYVLGLYDEALSAYDRVLVLDENNIEARLQSAMIYQKSGDTVMLKMELESLKNDHRLSKEDRQTLALLLKRLTDQEHKNQGDGFYGSFSMGIGYDTNPKKENLEPSFVYIPNLGKFPIPPSEYNPAWNNTLGFNLGYKYHLGKIYNFNLGLNTFARYYNKPKIEDFQNMIVGSVYFNNGIRMADFLKFNLSLSYDYMNLKDKAYSNSYTADASLDFSIGRFFGLELGYSYNKNLHIQEVDKIEDYNHFSNYAMLKIYFNRAMLYNKTSLEKERAIDKTNTSVNYDELSNTTGLIYMITSKVLYKINVNYSKSKYEKTIFKQKRIDKSIGGNTGFDFNINQNNTISLSSGYTRLKSTIDLNSYENYSISLSYRYNF